nr:hypothetical protein [Tanacetum cinerariifolium]
QVEPAALHQWPQHGQPRLAVRRARRLADQHRLLHPGRAQADAHQAHRHGVPEVRPDALADGAREHQLRPGDARPPGEGADQAG